MSHSDVILTESLVDIVMQRYVTRMRISSCVPPTSFPSCIPSRTSHNILSHEPPWCGVRYSFTTFAWAVCNWGILTWNHVSISYDQFRERVQRGTTFLQYVRFATERARFSTPSTGSCTNLQLSVGTCMDTALEATTIPDEWDQGGRLFRSHADLGWRQLTYGWVD